MGKVPPEPPPEPPLRFSVLPPPPPPPPQTVAVTDVTLAGTVTDRVPGMSSINPAHEPLKRQKS